MPNHWKWQAKDKDGQVVEAAPGMLFFDSRGPVSKAELIRSAQRMLNTLRYRATVQAVNDRDTEWNQLEGKERAAKRLEIAKEADPGYKVDADSVVALPAAPDQFDAEGNLTAFDPESEHEPVNISGLAAPRTAGTAGTPTGARNETEPPPAQPRPPSVPKP